MIILSRAIVLLIRAYQATKWLRPASCRFYPSCSEYTAQAVLKHGTGKGLLMGVFRLSKCQPFHPGGVDEVPAGVKAGRMPALPGGVAAPKIQRSEAWRVSHASRSVNTRGGGAFCATGALKRRCGRNQSEAKARRGALTERSVNTRGGAALAAPERLHMRSFPCEF